MNRLAPFLAGPSVGAKMAAADGRASGFDYMRLGLAILILAFHTLEQKPMSEIGQFLVPGPGRFLHDIIVPMFFGLGGFLVAGSLDRTKSLATYLGLRVLRIFPALWVDILFSALLLGPLLTTLPAGEYFAHPDFRLYFLNLVGEIHYLLPGVFKHNPNPLVNSQLWTVPWDLLGYFLLSVFVVLGFYRKPKTFLSVALWAQFIFAMAYLWMRLFTHMQLAPFRFVVVPCFLVGVAFHLYRDRIAWNRMLFFASLGVIAVSETITPLASLVLAAPILYVTVYLGLFNPRRLWIVRSGDYSYGVFLYHRQIQQTLWLLVPLARDWYWNLALSLPLAFILAFLSWHLVEKFALAQKHRLNARDAGFWAKWPVLRVTG